MLNVLGSAATHDAAGDFDTAGSAKAVQEAVDTLAKSLANIAKSGNMADALRTLAIEHGDTGATDAAAARNNLGLKADAMMTKSSADVTSLAGSDNEVATTKQLVQLRNNAITDIRLAVFYKTDMWSGGKFGLNDGELISFISITGAVGANLDYIEVSRLQF